MKIFQCGHCAHPFFLKATLVKIVAIYQVLEDRKMLTFEPNDDSLISDREQIEYRYCKNKEYNVCNWLVKRIPQKNFVKLVN
jgi:hypothetical protein